MINLIPRPKVTPTELNHIWFRSVGVNSALAILLWGCWNVAEKSCDARGSGVNGREMFIPFPVRPSHDQFGGHQLSITVFSGNDGSLLCGRFCSFTDGGGSLEDSFCKKKKPF